MHACVNVPVSVREIRVRGQYCYRACMMCMYDCIGVGMYVMFERLSLYVVAFISNVLRKI